MLAWASGFNAHCLYLFCAGDFGARPIPSIMISTYNDIGPELLNVSIRRIRLNSRILHNKKIGVNSIYKVIDVYVYSI